MKSVGDGLAVLLPLVNDNLDRLFGPTNSMFVTTTPRKFLFEGVDFCETPEEGTLEGVVCTLVEDNGSKTIVKSADGRTLKFAMFAHVKCKKYFEIKV